MFTRLRVLIAVSFAILVLISYFAFTGKTLDSKVAEIEKNDQDMEQQNDGMYDEGDQNEKIKGMRNHILDQERVVPPFFRLPTIRVPIVKDAKVTGYLYLKLEMEASSMDNFNEARILLSKLVDGIFTDLYSALSNLWISKENPKAEVIRERVLRVSNNILGKNKIKSVFVRQIFLDRQ